MFEIVKIDGKFGWNLRLAAGGRIIARGEQLFAKRSAVLADIKRVKAMAADAKTVEVL